VEYQSATSPCWCSRRRRVVRAFHNVCQTVGTGSVREPAPPERTSLPVSPLDLGPAGRPQAVPDRDGFPDFDDACFSLNSVRCEIWEGSSSSISTVRPSRSWTISRPSPNGSPLPLRGAHPHSQRHDAAGANWKTIVDGFLDVYHSRVSTPNSSRFSMTSTPPTSCSSAQRHVHAHGCRQSPLARPQRAGGHRQLARAGSGSTASCSASRSTSWRRRQGPLRDGVPVRQACSKSAASRGGSGRDYSG